MKSILPNLSQYKIVLGSNSPRRRELLAGLDIDFEVQTIPDIDESFPKTLRSDEVPVYIARKKAEAYISSMSADELLITADISSSRVMPTILPLHSTCPKTERSRRCYRHASETVRACT